MRPAARRTFTLTHTGLLLHEDKYEPHNCRPFGNEQSVTSYIVKGNSSESSVKQYKYLLVLQEVQGSIANASKAGDVDPVFFNTHVFLQ